MQAIISFVVLVVAVSLALWLGQILALHLPQWYRFLDRKPFNCRPCTTFHLIWSIVGLAALLLQNLLLFVVGVAVAFVVFLIVKYLDNKQIVR